MNKKLAIAVTFALVFMATALVLAPLAIHVYSIMVADTMIRIAGFIAACLVTCLGPFLVHEVEKQEA